MKVWTKVLLIISGLLLLSFLVPVVWLELTRQQTFFFFNRALLFPGLNSYVFWFAIVLIALIVIASLVILFFPKEKQVFQIQDENGTLKIHKKAIEGLVNSHLDEKDFVKKPKIQVKAVKNKMKIKVKGELSRTSQLIHQVDRFTASIKDEIKHLLGDHRNYDVKVDFTKLAPPSSKRQTRVE